MRLGVIALACALLTGCSSAQIDSQRVERQIKRWAEKNSGPNTQVTVECPSDIDVEPGREFHCIVSDQRGQSIGVTVTIENRDGYVTWQAG